MSPDELNPAQRGVSVDVLAERLTNHTQAMTSEFLALHHHFAALETKVDAYGEKVSNVETALHEHVLQQHHSGTRDRLIELDKIFLENERKFSEIDKKFYDIEIARVVEKSAIEARTKQRNTGLGVAEKAWLIAVGAIPIAILLYDRLS